MPQAQTPAAKTRQPFLARHRLSFLGKETASHNCFLGGQWAGQMLVQKCDNVASQQQLWVPGFSCMLAPSETAKILLRHWSQIHSSRDCLSVGNLHVFLEPRSSGSFLPKFTSKVIGRDLREGERCRHPDCVGR